MGRVLSAPNSQGRILATFISDEKAEKQPTDPAPAPSPRVLVGDSYSRTRWRPCGYPGCSRAHCDECDGAGR